MEKSPPAKFLLERKLCYLVCLVSWNDLVHPKCGFNFNCVFSGAFTPGCSKTHVPGYVEDAHKYREKGVDDIVCITVNDAFVAGAWAAAQGAEGKVRILADANAELTKALGLELDLTGPFGIGGLRTKRFSALVVDSEITVLNLEPDSTGLTCSLSPSLLTQV